MTILFILLGALLTAALIIAYVLFRFACLRPSEKNSEDLEGCWSAFHDEIKPQQKWLYAHVSEKRYIHSFDGLKLEAWIIPSAVPAKGVIVAMHGYHSRVDVDFAPEARFFHDMGYHLLLPCQRGHYGSEGRYITFGVKERFDCREWILEAERCFPGMPIFLAGISMGASTVMMAAGLELPASVKGLIADCGFDSPWRQVAYVAKRDFKLPKFPLLYLADWYAKCFAGFSFRSYSAYEAMQTNRLPILFLHGGSDRFVLEQMTWNCYNACTAEKEILIVQKAEHAQSFLISPDTCKRAIRSFLEKYNQTQP